MAKTTLTSCERVNRMFAPQDHDRVLPSVSWSTYQFIIEMVERYGNYD